MTPFVLGQRVTFSKVLRRQIKTWVGDGWIKIWEIERADGRFKRGDVIPQSGIVIGLRALNNGVATDLGPDQGLGYRRTQTVQAVLIATHLRRRPVFAPLDAVAPVEVG